MINALLIILTIYVLCTPFFYAKAVKFGIRMAEEPEEVAAEPIFEVPKPKKKPKMTKEQERLTKILSNIDNYNGTSAGQEKVNG